MAYVDANTTFTSLGFREDGDGKVWIWATALEDLTAATPYVCFVGSTGYTAEAAFDTGMSDLTTTVPYHLAYIGVPKEAITSDNSGWLQIGGYNASVTLATQTVTAGSGIRWNIASMVGTSATYTGAVNEWAVSYAANTEATNVGHAIFQVPRLVSGTS